ncbi:MAG: M55 family metallopeptidase [Myxococcaceae bacterium]|nr:M55 family metallopeptidase [Myxococcaceae bacterium]
MKTALLVVDLEGVAGVDDVEALTFASRSHDEARVLLTTEVRAAVEGLEASGYSRIVVSDSHLSGSQQASVVAGGLPASAELVFLADDAYAPLASGVDAVACLGMHAAAGTAGFAAHTVAPHCAWRIGKRTLSELDLVLGLAAERGIPRLFASGDDVLGRTWKGDGYVTTKRSRSVLEARSITPERSCAALRKAAARCTPRKAPALPAGKLELHFKSRWQAELAEQAGARRLTDFSVLVPGKGAEARYREGLRLVEASGAPLGDALRGALGSPEFCEDAGTLLARGFSRTTASAAGPAKKALQAFLALTSAPADEPRALRALTLFMLRGHAPDFFRAQRLGPVFDAALEALRAMPLELGGLSAPVAMARLDALYVLEAVGTPRTGATGLDATIAACAAELPLWAWLLSQLGAPLGLCGRFPAPQGLDRLSELYFLTHLVLLETRYLSRPLAPAQLAPVLERLSLASDWAIAQGNLDIGAELAFCLRHAGEAPTPELARLTAFLVAAQGDDGSVFEPGDQGDPHGTAAALLALAGEWPRARPISRASEAKRPRQ